MAVYHQMGHDSTNLLWADYLDRYAGAVLSPVNENETEIDRQIREFSTPEFRMIFDPQLYYPNTQRGQLPKWDYFPSDVDTADQTSLRWWRGLNTKLVATLRRLNPDAVCSPIVVPRVFNDDYYQMSCAIAAELRSKLGSKPVTVIQTVLAELKDLSQVDRSAQIASIITASDCDEVYLVLVSNVEPRRELREVEDIKGAMRLIKYIEDAGVEVLVGFVSTDVILWKAAGANACATGKFFNLRRFTPSRWEEPSQGGGQVPYWTEEALMAFLRESDLIRIRKVGLLSPAGTANPYGQQILAQLDSAPNQPWLALSWRQYLYWFADFENRLATGETSARTVLREAERVWDSLPNFEPEILMEERPNEGGWLRPWRRAIAEA